MGQLVRCFVGSIYMPLDCLACIRDGPFCSITHIPLRSFSSGQRFRAHWHPRKSVCPFHSRIATLTGLTTPVFADEAEAKLFSAGFDFRFRFLVHGLYRIALIGRSGNLRGCRRRCRRGYGLLLSRFARIRFGAAHHGWFRYRGRRCLGTILCGGCRRRPRLRWIGGRCDGSSPRSFSRLGVTLRMCWRYDAAANYYRQRNNRQPCPERAHATFLWILSWTRSAHEPVTEINECRR